MIFDVAIENLYKITRLGKRRDDWDVIQIDVVGNFIPGPNPTNMAPDDIRCSPEVHM